MSPRRTEVECQQQWRSRPPEFNPVTVAHCARPLWNMSTCAHCSSLAYNSIVHKRAKLHYSVARTGYWKQHLALYGMACILTVYVVVARFLLHPGKVLRPARVLTKVISVLDSNLKSTLQSLVFDVQLARPSRRSDRWQTVLPQVSMLGVPEEGHIAGVCVHVADHGNHTAKIGRNCLRRSNALWLVCNTK